MPGVPFNTPEPPNLAASDQIEAVAAAEAPAVCAAPAEQPSPVERPVEHRKRARKPAGSADGGEFQGDNPSTADVNEAWEG